nr:unnamed protein product [Callosobruchus analis]
MAMVKIVVAALLSLVCYTKADSRVICYYDHRSNFREVCTHLIYGYAGINPDNYKMVPLNEAFDVNKDNYRHITELKRRFPGLRVLLSVGGGNDISGEGQERNLVYRTVLESVDHRLTFINSAKDLVKHYGFDGLDLAWEFPETKPKKIRSSFKQFFVNLKHKIVGESVVDEKAEEHKEQFTALVREIRNSFRHDGLLLSMLQNGFPANKLIYGISTYGRTWKMTEDSGLTGVPPFYTEGPGEEGPYTKEAGLLAYPEICSKIATPKEIQAGYLGKLRKINDPTKRFGTYAYRLPKDDKEGIWVSFEDPDTVTSKASYVKAKGLGGVALVDLTLDDFRGLCTGDKYPILRAANFTGGWAISIALQYCTHLIYGYAAINEDTLKVMPLNEQFDVIKDNYRKVTDLKKKYPKLKVLLSVGGNEDLETSARRLALVNSAHTLVKGFGFDGIDLAWEFPETKPKKIKSGIGAFWSSVKKTFAGEGVIDEHAEEHRQQFSSLVKELKSAFRPDNLLVTLTVLPNVNSTVYYDPRTLVPHLDYIILHAFDFIHHIVIKS